ncbi:transcription factor bhlh113 [Phtheirospermum japonicum]|uniref:Transcription factor bhlh113 n=1 Tax=Phtheirospermum japonicum TaxID=374723 RepID=A0A830CRJ5_9LAMI|nr:transcription factor bhlh113 [Phtheirospermum japonicum]
MTHATHARRMGNIQSIRAIAAASLPRPPSQNGSGLIRSFYLGMKSRVLKRMGVSILLLQCNMTAAVENANNTGQKSGPACKDNSSLPISKKKRNGAGIQNSGDRTGSQRNSKKPKPDISGHAKVVRKEKLGDRITALQQLVSPFGKTDTASVLHEALGYIRFLHDQVQVLCSPYLQRWSTSSEVPHHPDNKVSKESERRKNDLRSRGLCLVPVELTLHVADSNGADLWSSGAMVDTVPTS